MHDFDLVEFNRSFLVKFKNHLDKNKQLVPNSNWAEIHLRTQPVNSFCPASPFLSMARNTSPDKSI